MVYTDFPGWKQDGTLTIHDELQGLSHLMEGRSNSPSALMIDSQSVETATMIAEAVGDDGINEVKGRKRHLTIETLGLVCVSSSPPLTCSNVRACQRVLKQIKQMGQTVRPVHTVCVSVDGDYGVYLVVLNK